MVPLAVALEAAREADVALAQRAEPLARVVVERAAREVLGVLGKERTVDFKFNIPNDCKNGRTPLNETDSVCAWNGFHLTEQCMAQASADASSHRST